MSDEPKLTNCPVCNQKVSSHASDCPSCAHPLSAAKKSEKEPSKEGAEEKNLKVVVGLLVAILIILTYFGYIVLDERCRAAWDDHYELIGGAGATIKDGNCPWEFPD